MNLKLQCSSLQLPMNSLSASREFDSISNDFIHTLNNAGQFENMDFSVLPIGSVPLPGFIWALTTQGRKQRCLPCKSLVLGQIQPCHEEISSPQTSQSLEVHYTQ